MTIIESIAKRLNLREWQVQAVLDLFDQEATIPFIAHYRKHLTGNLDEEQLRKIKQAFQGQTSLQKKKMELLQMLTDKNLLHDTLRDSVVNASTLIALEELSAPYQSLTEEEIQAQQELTIPFLETLDHPQGSFTDLESLRKGLIRHLSEDNQWHDWVYAQVKKNGFLVSKPISSDHPFLKKSGSVGRDCLSKLSTHRILKLLRGAQEGTLSLSISVPYGPLEDKLVTSLIPPHSPMKGYLKRAIHEALIQFLLPRIKREVLAMLQEQAYESALTTFAINYEDLLMVKPIKDQVVLAWDPGYRKGCKAVMLAPNGQVLDSLVVYPFSSHDRSNLSLQNARRTALLRLRDFLLCWEPSLIVLGNGAGYVESASFWTELFNDFPRLTYTVAPKIGTSYYAQSEKAQQEFPHLSNELIPAISLGRRVQDPLAELIKMDPQTLGIGEHQHDLPKEMLKERLDFVSQKVVNRVRVNVNTASRALLNHVSGLCSEDVERIIQARQVAPFQARTDLKRILSPHTYEQAIGFLYIEDGNNPLDATSIHPESYNLALQILKRANVSLESIKLGSGINYIKAFNPQSLAQELKSDVYTIEQILRALTNPNFDPRESQPSYLLRTKIQNLKDLHPGMKLEGVVRNVISFGAFIDIGLAEEGVVHISQLSKQFVQHPWDYVRIGQIVQVYVDSIDACSHRVALTLLPTTN